MNRCFYALQRSPGSVGFILMIVLCLSWNPAYSAGEDWNQLSSREQTVLKPFKSQWDKYSAQTKKTMLSWAKLSSVEREKIKKRHAQWRKLTAARKAKIIRKLDRYKHMSLAKRLKLQAWRKWVKRLPKVEQQKLHKRLPGMNAKQRKAYIHKLEEKYGKR